MAKINNTTSYPKRTSSTRNLADYLIGSKGAGSSAGGTVNVPVDIILSSPKPASTVTVDYTAQNNESVIRVNSSSEVTITFPASVITKEFEVINIGVGRVKFATTNSEKINGENASVWYIDQFEVFKISGTGSSWTII